MPIYAYKCSACGHARDVLQKMSDPLLTVCPECGADQFVKQVTAAGFQLKGSGWYATDFRGGNTGAPPAESASDKPAAAADAPAVALKSDSSSTGSTPAPAPAAAPVSAPAPAVSKAD